MRKLTALEIANQRLSIEEANQTQRVPIIVVVDNVRSLYNVGSIFRTSDGVMIEKIYLTGFTPHPPRREIDKTALGATKTIPWEYQKNPLSIISKLKESGYKICSLEITDLSVPYYSIRSSDFPLVLVIGNEITGISQELISLSDIAISIPMSGTKHSLNVAVAYGIALFELGRIFRQTNSAMPTRGAKV